MNEGSLAPVIAGFAIGVGMIVLFASIFSYPYKTISSMDSPGVRKGNDVTMTFVNSGSTNVTHVADKVDISVNITGNVFGCVAPPRAEIRAIGTGQIVWDSGFSLVLCDPDLREHKTNIFWHLTNEYIENGNRVDNTFDPIIIARAGDYEIAIVYAGKEITKPLRIVPAISTVVISNEAGNSTTSHYQPQIVTVKLGENNTVRWTNKDTVPHWIEADNYTDPDFFNATNDDNRKFLGPNDSFDYTFSKAGKFGYHGKPGMRGTVVVNASG